MGMPSGIRAIQGPADMNIWVAKDAENVKKVVACLTGFGFGGVDQQLFCET